jgi:hypothetical protein
MDIRMLGKFNRAGLIVRGLPRAGRCEKSSRRHSARVQPFCDCDGMTAIGCKQPVTNDRYRPNADINK